MFAFLNNRAVLAASVLIFVEGLMMFGASRPEAIPAGQPLSVLPENLGAWHEAQEGVIDQETRDVLKADDLLNRFYIGDSGQANLFVAAFRSQRNGKAPHSPKNCLPGSGWVPLRSDELAVDSGMGAPIHVNRYVVANGDNRDLVLYWYQSRDRAVASEYAAKYWVVVDAMRLNRTDTALVRVVVPIVDRDEEKATKTATDFVRAFYPPLRGILPS